MPNYILLQDGSGQITLQDDSGQILTQDSPNAFEIVAAGGTYTLTGSPAKLLAFGDLVQNVAAFAADSDPETCVFADNVVEGNLLVVCFTTEQEATVTSVTDTLGNTYQLAASHQNVGFDAYMRMYAAVANGSGANTISVTIDGAFTTGMILAAEYQGPFDSSPLDDSAGNSAISANSSSGDVTPTVDGSLLVGWTIAAADLTVAGGWTVDEDTSNALGFSLLTHSLQTTATADAAEATLAANVWLAIAANFKPQGDPVIVANGGTYALAGAAVGLTAARTISAAGGTYSLAGANVTLTPGRVVLAAGGTYAISGAAAGLTTTRTITAAGGVYSLAGANVALTAGRMIAIGGGVYAITGANVSLDKGFTLVAGNGTYALAGTDADLLTDYVVAALSGTYSISGAAVSFLQNRVLIADGGVYVLTGKQAALEYSSLLAVTKNSFIPTFRPRRGR